MTVSNNSQYRALHEHETTGNMQCIQHVNKCKYPKASYIR